MLWGNHYRQTELLMPKVCRGAIVMGARKLYLQRQGVGSTTNFSGAGFSLEVVPEREQACVSVYFSDHHRTFGSVQEALSELGQHHETANGLTVAAETLAYKHERGATYVYQRQDFLFSPFFYCAYSDTVRHSATNIGIVGFEGGAFERRFAVDRASECWQPFIDRALEKGFHACDRKSGDDYCKRRLAWLAGVYFMEAQTDPYRVGVLTPQMEWPTARLLVS